MPGTGYRAATPRTFTTQHTAEAFAGLPDGFTHHGQLLEHAERCGAALPLPRKALPLLRLLLSYTNASEWRPRSRPVVYVSNATLARALDVDPRTVKIHLAELEEAGALWRVMTGPETREIDLSPLAALAPAIRRIAHQADAARKALGQALRRIHVARGLLTMAATAAEEIEDAATRSRVEELEHLAAIETGGPLDQVDQAEAAAAAIEELAAEAAELVRAPAQVPQPEAGSPPGDPDAPHTPTTPSHSVKSGATASVFGEGVAQRASDHATPAPANLVQYRWLLYGAYPRLRQVLEDLGRDPIQATEHDMKAAAEVIRHEVGASQWSWDVAEARHGWGVALAALIVAAAKPADQVRATRGALFGGMIQKEPAELRPWPSLHGLRKAARAAHDGALPPRPTVAAARLPDILDAMPKQLGRIRQALALMPDPQRERWAQLATERGGVPVDPNRPSSWVHLIAEDFRTR